MKVNFGIEYLCTFAIESPVGLPNKAKFEKISSFLSFLRVSVVIILV